MRVAFAGEVDHGKSSLIGRLLLDTKSLSRDKLSEMDKISKELGVEACLAFLVDQFIEEREGLLTIDTTEIVLKIKNKYFVCIDTPGHFKFLKNMMTGASRADAAVIVIDALRGVEEQTLMHAHILKMFGITSILFAVNKMDLVDHQEAPFRLIEDAVKILSGKAGITPQAVIPVSARYGINITRNSAETKWYKGLSLVPAMDHFKEPPVPARGPLRLPVQDIYQIDGYPVIVGRLSKGTISKNQKVMVLPSMEETQINDIKIFGQKRTSARCGENVGLSFASPAKIKRGDVLCGLDDRLLPARRFQAQILWLAETPPQKNAPVTIQISTQQLQCTIQSIEQTLNASSFNATLGTAGPAAVEPFALTHELGRFVIGEKGRPSGAGIITKILGTLLYCIFLLGINTLPATAFAQNKIEDQNSFLGDFVKQTNGKEWKPLADQKEDIDQNATESDVKGLQALSYLQGYNPAPLLKNVTLYDKQRAFAGYNLFLSGAVPGAILMDMEGKTIYQWHYPTASLPVDLRYCSLNWDRVRILKNGDLLALITFGGLLKIDKNSRLIWFTKMTCHHDFDVDDDGNIYTLTVKNSRSGLSAGVKINSIVILSPDGKIKNEISLYDLFKDYPNRKYINTIYRSVDYVLSGGSKFPGFIPGDAFHANSIQVLDGKWVSKNPAFKKGNVLVSIRTLNTVICVDPGKKKIVWLMDKSFWNRGQHFAKMLDNGDITVFDNLYGPNSSRVVEFDPSAMKLVWQYAGQNSRFYSSYLGEEYRLPNGNTLITESENGISIEVTPDKKIVWEFYNPNQIDKHNGTFFTIKKILHFPDNYNKLIAITSQMQRIPADASLDWLNGQKT